MAGERPEGLHAEEEPLRGPAGEQVCLARAGQGVVGRVDLHGRGSGSRSRRGVRRLLCGDGAGTTARSPWSRSRCRCRHLGAAEPKGAGVGLGPGVHGRPPAPIVQELAAREWGGRSLGPEPLGRTGRSGRAPARGRGPAPQCSEPSLCVAGVQSSRAVFPEADLWARPRGRAGSQYCGGRAGGFDCRGAS